MRKIVGVISVVLVVLSLGPNIVPGAMSLIGLVITLFALVMSVFSVEKGKSVFFKVTLVFSAVGILAVNDTMRIYGAIPGVPVEFKVGVYFFLLVVIAGCIYSVKKLLREECT